MRYLIAPTKNVALAQSIIGISALIYNIVKEGCYFVDETFEIIKKDYYNNKLLNYDVDFNQFILGICFLYSIKKINIKENGVIYCETD